MAGIGELKEGDAVRVLEPFNTSFPAVYPIDYIKPDGTCGICTDRDFDPKYLEKV